jgi:hypothetical protein
MARFVGLVARWTSRHAVRVAVAANAGAAVSSAVGRLRALARRRAPARLGAVVRRATFYGTEGHRFESCRARYSTGKIVRICREFVAERTTCVRRLEARERFWPIFWRTSWRTPRRRAAALTPRASCVSSSVPPGLVAIEIPHANRMRDIVEHGCRLWESVVAEDRRPWSDYITPGQRRMLRRVAADVQDEINRGRRLRAQIRADMRARPVVTPLRMQRGRPR